MCVSFPQATDLCAFVVKAPLSKRGRRAYRKGTKDTKVYKVSSDKLDVSAAAGTLCLGLPVASFCPLCLGGKFHAVLEEAGELTTEVAPARPFCTGALDWAGGKMTRTP